MTDIGQRPRFGQRLRAASWRDLLFVAVPTLLVAALAVGVAIKAARFAPPKTIYFTSGPPGSGYRNQAEKYQKILARDGVKLEIIPSKGALDNLDKLANQATRIDVGFVQGGLAEGRATHAPVDTAAGLRARDRKRGTRRAPIRAARA